MATMATRRWYMPALIAVVVVIGTGAAFSIPSIHGWRSLNPFAKRTTGDGRRTTGDEATSAASAPVRQQASPVVHDPSPAVAPPAVAPPVARRPSPVPQWKPSDE